jgi:hypothetical protein
MEGADVNDVQKLMVDIMGPGAHVRNLRKRIDRAITEYQVETACYDDVVIEVEIEEVG